MDLFLAQLVVIEVLLVFLCIYTLLRRHMGLSSLISISFSLGLTILCFSLILQVCFLFGSPSLCFVLEILLVLFSFRSVYLSRRIIFEDFERIRNCRKSILILIFASSPLAYLYFQSITLQPNNQDSLVYTLARILLYEDGGTLFPQTISDYTQVCYPIGNDILYYLFLRFDISRGTAFFSFLAYVGSICATYSLVRTFYSRETAGCCALIFACLPEIVYQSTTPKNDLMVVFLSLTTLLAFAKLAQKTSFGLLSFLFLFLAGGIAAKTTFLAFALPSFLFFLFWIIKKSKTSEILILLNQNMSLSFALFFVCLLLSQVWLFGYNIWAWGTWCGPPFLVDGNSNSDGIFGTLANLCRYFFESFHLTQPFDETWEKAFNHYPSAFVQNLYDTYCVPLFGELSLAQPFVINWSQTEDTWYGPFGFLAAWVGAPCAFFYRKSPAKLAAVLAFVFLFLVAYKIKWWSSNQRYLACFFSLTVIASAPMLAQVAKSKFVIRFLCLISLLIGLHAVLFNVTKPFFHFLSPRVDMMLKDSIINETNIWNQTNWGKDTWWPHSLGDWKTLELEGNKVGIIANNHHNHFDFIKAHPETQFFGLAHDRCLMPSQYERILSNEKIDLNEMDYLLMLSVEHESYVEGGNSMLRVFTRAENTVKEVPILPNGVTIKKHWQHTFAPNKEPYVLYEVKHDPTLL